MPAVLSPTNSRDIGHAENASDSLRQFMDMDGWMDGWTDGWMDGGTGDRWLDGLFVCPLFDRIGG